MHLQTPAVKAKRKSKRSLDHRLTFASHILEIRNRLLWCVGALLLGTAVGYVLHDELLIFLIQPLGQTLYFTSPAGAFDFIVQLSIYFGLLVSVPVFVYHLLRFISPALPAEFEKKTLLMLVFSTGLVALGVSFAYFVSLPAALRFLAEFETSNIQSLISTSDYFSFVTRYLLGFGILFQLPLLLLLLNAVVPLSVSRLMGYQRWVMLISFILAAILTPTTDVFNQLLFAVPLIVLYQFSVGLIWAVNKLKSP